MSAVIVFLVLIIAIVASCFLPFLGFTDYGIGAGSFAAWWRSVTGNVVSGSIFAFLQSLGATGGVLSFCLRVFFFILFVLGCLVAVFWLFSE